MQLADLLQHLGQGRGTLTVWQGAVWRDYYLADLERPLLQTLKHVWCERLHRTGTNSHTKQMINDASRQRMHPQACVRVQIARVQRTY